MVPALLGLVLTMAVTAAGAGQKPPAAPSGTQGADKPAPAGDKSAEKPPAPEKPEEPPVITHHELHVGGRTLRYTATVGRLPIKSDKGELEASIFYMAYTLDGVTDVARRPLIFSFNGGPGSSSVWLHLGAIGPRRVRMLDDGGLPAPPYALVDNEQTWLDKADLVFIDPVGTGYSRASKPELGAKFWNLDGDIQSVSDFIRLYLTRAHRWASPLFLVGESYGTTRASGLAGNLIDRGVAFNGIILVSSILNFQTAEFTKGNDLPYVLYLPTYTATAWYHKKLAPDLQADLQSAVTQAEAFALGAYATALVQGDQLPAADRAAIASQVSRFTGLSPEYVRLSDLRIEIQRFCKELLRSDRRTVGRLDSRFTGIDGDGAAGEPEYDPSMAAIRPPYTAAFQHYVATELGYTSDEQYYILGGGFTQWAWNRDNSFVDTTEALRRAFTHNPHMRLFIASGYYDLATPYFATAYTISHLGLDPVLRERVAGERYQAGHMMYIDVRELARLRSDVGAFLDRALATSTGPGAADAPATGSGHANFR
jgi:carboxypeptidase C (cathepsin A)